MSSEKSAKVSNAQQIWNEIKDKTIDVFANPKTVSFYFKEANFDPEKCFLKSSVPAALPALETALGKAFTCELVENLVLVERVKTLGK